MLVIIQINILFERYRFPLLTFRFYDAHSSSRVVTINRRGTRHILRFAASCRYAAATVYCPVCIFCFFFSPVIDGGS